MSVSRECKSTGKRKRVSERFHRGEGDRNSEYLGLFSAEFEPLLDWVLWEEMEKLSSQVLISDQSLQSQPTAKLLHPDTLREGSNQPVESNVQKMHFYHCSVILQR